MELKNIYLVQAAEQFSGNTKAAYLPYAVGTVAAKALSNKTVRAAFNLDRIVFLREPIEQIVDSLNDPFLIGFSNYIWNYEYNKAVAKKIKDKRVDKRLWAVQLRGEGMGNPEIAEKLDTSTKVVSRWVSAYSNGGIEALMGGKFGGNRRNMSFEKETQILAEFKARAKTGQLVEVSEIKQAYEEAVGHSIGGGQIYRVLKRHGWRKVMPRAKHPKRASDEVIEASKKLTFDSEK